jgi:hypothetical protein
MPRKRENPLTTPSNFAIRFLKGELEVPSDHRFDPAYHATVETDILAYFMYGREMLFSLELLDGQAYVQDIYAQYIAETPKKLWQFNKMMKAFGLPVVKFNSVIGPYWSDLPRWRDLASLDSIKKYLFYNDRFDLSFNLETIEGVADEEE